MVDISAALTSIRTISGVAVAAGKIEITQHVIELQQALLGLQAENAELASSKRELTEKVEELSQALNFTEGLVFDRNAYWRGESENREGPFCSRCFDAESLVVRLIENRENVGTCHNCKNTVRLDGPVRPRPRVRGEIHPGVSGWVNGWKRD